MRSDAIEALGIEDDATLWVKPVMATFPHIYREAMDVHWDAEWLRLYSPKPRDGPMSTGLSRSEMRHASKASS